MFNPDTHFKCYACDKVTKITSCECVETEDNQLQSVGPECYRKVKKSLIEGYQPPTGGPRLFLPCIRPPRK